MSRLPLALASALAATLLVSTPAYACKCMLPELQAAREDASALFEGRVLSIDLVEGASDATNGEKKVTLSVVRTWKGLDNNEQVIAYTNGSTAACGYPFAKDVSYLIYAREHEGKITVSNCSRTKQIADASEDLAALGAGATPVTIVPKAVETSPVKTPDGAAAPSAAPPSEKKGCGGGTHALLPWLVVPFARRRRPLSRQR